MLDQSARHTWVSTHLTKQLELARITIALTNLDGRASRSYIHIFLNSICTHAYTYISKIQLIINDRTVQMAEQVRASGQVQCRAEQWRLSVCRWFGANLAEYKDNMGFHICCLFYLFIAYYIHCIHVIHTLYM